MNDPSRFRDLPGPGSALGPGPSSRWTKAIAFVGFGNKPFIARFANVGCWHITARPAEQPAKHPPHPVCSVFHISMSRSAVQMRGCSMPLISSKQRETSNGMQCSKITHWPYLGCIARYVAS